MAGKISYYVTVDYLAELRHVYQGSLGKLEKEVKLAFACEKEKADSKSFSICINESSATKKFKFEICNNALKVFHD